MRLRRTKTIQKLLSAILLFNICVIIILNLRNVITIKENNVFNSLLPSFVKSSGFRIRLKDKHCLRFKLNGTIFLNGGKQLIQQYIKTCFVTSFSSIVEEEISQKFLNIYENITSWVKSPSILRHNDIYYVTFRIRLRQNPQKQTSENETVTDECWEYKCALNYLYLMKFDLDFNPIGTGEIIAIPAPQGRSKHLNGPHDARLFQLKGGLYASLSVKFNQSWVSIIWDFQKHKPYLPQFQKELLLKGAIVIEKNWVPAIINNTLYLIRHLDPMHILQCLSLNNCTLIANGTETLFYQIVDELFPLRGGTNFEEYRYPYFIAVAHSTNFRGTTRIYRAHLVVLCVKPYFRIVYVSDPLKIHPHIYSLFSGPKFWKIVEDGFFFPVGLLIEIKDRILIGAHVNDHGSLLLRLHGLENILNRILEMDMNLKTRGKSRGSHTAFNVQNFLLRRMAMLEVSSYIFIVIL